MHTNPIRICAPMRPAPHTGHKAHTHVRHTHIGAHGNTHAISGTHTHTTHTERHRAHVGPTHRNPQTTLYMLRSVTHNQLHVTIGIANRSATHKKVCYTHPTPMFSGTTPTRPAQTQHTTHVTCTNSNTHHTPPDQHRYREPHTLRKPRYQLCATAPSC